MTYKLAYGSTDFPAGFKPVSLSSSYDIAAQERPRQHGAITQRPRKGPVKLAIAGNVVGATLSTIQSTIDALRANVQGNPAPQKLYFGRDDRYIWAQCVSIPESYGGSGGDGMEASWFGAAHGLAEIGFDAAWPFFFDDGGATAVNLSHTGGTVTTTGNAARMLAEWTVKLTTGGTGSFSLSNAATGETALVTGTFANGDIVTVQRGLSVPSASGGVGTVYQALVNSVETPSILLGEIPQLQAGANTVTISVVSGPIVVSTTSGDVQVSYTEGWES